MGNDFRGIDEILDLGEKIACVYFICRYDETKAIQYMKWKGFKVHMQYRFNGFMIFYQDEAFIPNLSVEDEFHKIVDEYNMWENMPSGNEYDYKYRMISKDIICVSFISCYENAEAIKKTGKIKKE